MEELINGYLELSNSVEYYYQLELNDKMNVFNLALELDKLEDYNRFLNEKITFNQFMGCLTKKNGCTGRRSPDKKYLKLAKEERKFAFKNLTKQEYNIAKKGIYKSINDFIQINDYYTEFKKFFLVYYFGISEQKDKDSIMQELKRLEEYLERNKNLGL
jgi:hypothetical protein